jgi:hypothetical protein
VLAPLAGPDQGCRDHGQKRQGGQLEHRQTQKVAAAGAAEHKRKGQQAACRYRNRTLLAPIKS